MEPCDVCGRELRSVNHAAGQNTCGRASCLQEAALCCGQCGPLGCGDIEPFGEHPGGLSESDLDDDGTPLCSS